MTDSFSQIPSNKRRLDRIFAWGWGVLAALFYTIPLSLTVFPGESANLMAQVAGVTPSPLPLHPLFSTLSGWISGLPFFSIPLRLNLMSLILVACSAAMLYRLVSFFLFERIGENVRDGTRVRASVWGGSVAALSFIVSAPILQSASRFQYQSFDLAVLLGLSLLLVSFIKRRKNFLLVIFALLWGMISAESVLAIQLFPVFLLYFLYAIWNAGNLQKKLQWLFMVILLSAASLLAVYWISASAFISGNDPDLIVYKSVWDVILAVLRAQFKLLRGSLPSSGWLVMLFMGVIPWVISIFSSFKAFDRNGRTSSFYILHITFFTIVLLNLANMKFSPWGLFEPSGVLPVLSSTMVAMLAGYVTAYFFILMKTSSRSGERGSGIRKLIGTVFLYVAVILPALASVNNLLRYSGKRGAFADLCAREILDHLDGRIWFVTDGTLDDHLLINAKERGVELNLICLQNDMDPTYLARMKKRVEEKRLFSKEDQRKMENVLSLGILPFIQDWFAMDKEVEKKVAVFGVPDFWYTAGAVPVPQNLFFTGSRDAAKEYGGAKLLDTYRAFWQKMEKPLAALPDKSVEVRDPVVRFRLHLRRHMGFVANNAGVFLEDLGRKSEAFSVYSYVHDSIDADNISALFNMFEVARGNEVQEAMNKRESIEKELKDFVTNLKRSYPLWSLSRYYGYVRSPQLFARLGWGWALSGQTGAALAGIDRAIKLLPSADRNSPATMQAMAAIYALSEDKSKSSKLYQDIIKTDPTNRSALLGLAQLSMKEGKVDEAKDWLTRAIHSEKTRGAMGVERAVLFMMNNDLVQARMALQEATDLQPKNLQAWSMLALIQLQQGEIEDIERVTLPKMQSNAGTVKNYYIQLTRASLASKKVEDLAKQMSSAGKDLQKMDPGSSDFKQLLVLQQRAREAFIQASLLRPDIVEVKDRVLQLDISMNDQAAAELHARQVLRINRKHALANYVMGSLRLQEGQYGAAEDFLRQSVETNPTAAALNDLAEVLRRIKRYDDAEKFARQAVELTPDLYVAWETLASVLLEREGKINEAEQAINKSLSLYGGDLRVLITQARIVLKKGNVEKARQLIAKLKTRSGELSDFDRDALDKLNQSAKSSK